MTALADARLIARLAPEQRGVFSKADLQTALGEAHPAAFVRRIQALENESVLRRFIKGWYVAETFDAPALSQRIGPRSYISFGNVLSRELLVGSKPERQILAAKIGRPRTYRGLGYEIVHLAIAPHLDFGHKSIEGVHYADAEKAMLDILYFHLRGRRYFFDIYSDIRLEKLKKPRMRDYLLHYRNPKFVAFAKDFLSLQ